MVFRSLVAAKMHCVSCLYSVTEQCSRLEKSRGLAGDLRHMAVSSLWRIFVPVSLAELK